MTPRYVCIHGHFYQPPRENPWLESVQRQDSAFPYHDWNERVTRECYAPNADSRILDERKRIVRIVNNYERISFDVGPTLMAWLKPNAPRTYAAILEADRRGAERFSGHGPAMAQAYGHIILPLANERDRRTQVRWGLQDFRHRFGREPEGMWLPETAADRASLEALAEAGIRFTVLAPSQAAAVRPPGGAWEELNGQGVDTTRPYRVELPSGREIGVFFYDGAIAQAVAFGDILADGAAFARRLTGAFPRDGGEAPLVHIATDGETYGHHHTHGEMALSYALREIERADDVRLTTYGEYLERHPPTWEVRIVEGSSWSCVHGVERWRSDCGCRAGRGQGWHQRWRGPLRAALDGLRDWAATRYEAAASELLRDPWAARDDYAQVILDRSRAKVDAWLEGRAARPLDRDDRVRTLELLELQRHAMLMYTSCGWFFDEISDIETVQVLRYAGRAVHLARCLFGEDPEPLLLGQLRRASANRPEKGDGARIYAEAVGPGRVDLPAVGAHYAVSSLFESYGPSERVHCYRVQRESERRLETGRARLALGRIVVTSVLTRRSARLGYAVLHLGDHTVVGGMREFRGDEAWGSLEGRITEAFSRADYPGVVRILDAAFEASTYSLRSLFRDEREKVVHRILESTLEDVEAAYDRLYTDLDPLMRFLADLGMRPPRPFEVTAEYVLNTRLRRELAEEPPDLQAARTLLKAAAEARVELDRVSLAHVARDTLERVFSRFEAKPRDMDRLRAAAETEALVRELPFEVNLWAVENAYYRVLHHVYPGMLREAGAGHPAAAAWVDRFRALGERLTVAVD